MTSKERLAAAYRREEPDRVPIRIWGVTPGTKAIHPSYQPVIAAALQKTDIVASWGMSQGLFLSGTDDVAAHGEMRPSSHEHFRERVTTYETPEGPLVSCHLSSEDGRPGYTSKYLIETKEDARRFLSIPYVPIREDCAGFQEKVAELGDRGIVIASTACHGMYNIQRLMGSELFAVWSVEERGLLHELIENQHQRVKDRLKWMIEQEVGPFFGYVGPELCIPPLQSVRDFNEFVVQYDRELADLVHNVGGYLWVHSHGKMGPVLEGFVEIGADCLNPLEPPPMGDMTLAEVRQRIGHKLCLEGNIQAGDLYRDSPEAIRRKVYEAIQQAAPGGGFILCPTSGLQEWPVCSVRLRENFLTLIEAGLEYGQYPIQ